VLRLFSSVHIYLGSPGVTLGPKLDSTIARLRKGSVRVGFEVELLRPVRVGVLANPFR
jgi:hypothetical protein